MLLVRVTCLVNREVLMTKRRFVSNLSRVLAVLALLCGAAFAANPVPYINLPLVPSSIKPGSAQFTLTVNGAGFVSGSVVNWNGSPRSTTLTSSRQLTATILASDVATSGTASITVQSPVSGGISNVAFLTVANTVRNLAFSARNAPLGFSLVQADFNGDGKLDELIAGPQASTISVLLGNGDATFRFVASYFVPGGDTAVGDFNDDGTLDLAITDDVSSVQILLGNGDGTFTISSAFPTAPGPIRVAAGDFNRDGQFDLAVLCSSGVVSILLGDGDGTFQTHVDYTVGSAPVSLVIGDFNNDGVLDVTTASANGFDQNVSTLLGNGDGSFQNPLTSNQGGTAGGDMTAADFNSDGVLDLAVPLFDRENGSMISVLLGDGTGSFVLQNTYPVAGSQTVTVGDFENNGIADLAVLGSGVYILRGNGDGSFRAPLKFATQGGGPGIFVGDLNADGRLDLFNAAAIVQTPYAATFTPTSLKFTEPVGLTSPVKEAKLINTGELPLKISSLSTVAPFSETNDCPSTLDLFKGCIVDITFSPTVAGTQQGTVTVNANGLNPPPTLTLIGTGLALSLSPASVNFGNQPVGISSQPQPVTLTNQTTTSVAIQSINILGANRKDFSQSNNCVTLGGKASCTINVVFTPSALGSRSAYVSIVDANGARYNVALSGTGT
jgi:hypothetical protein